MPPPAEITLHLARLLEEEVIRWPGVSTRPMFGMHALYRGDSIFAVLPDKRTMERPTAIGYKLPSEGKNWKLCDLESEAQIGPALARLREAYRRARTAK
jgi:hypothetical protein